MDIVLKLGPEKGCRDSVPLIYRWLAKSRWYFLTIAARNDGVQNSIYPRPPGPDFRPKDWHLFLLIAWLPDYPTASQPMWSKGITWGRLWSMANWTWIPLRLDHLRRLALFELAYSSLYGPQTWWMNIPAETVLCILFIFQRLCRCQALDPCLNDQDVLPLCLSHIILLLHHTAPILRLETKIHHKQGCESTYTIQLFCVQSGLPWQCTTTFRHCWVADGYQ